jgi:transketolase
MNSLEQRILDISYEKKLSHIGSCLTAVNIIRDIYKIRKPDEPFVLSSGHAALALYVVLEDYFKVPGMAEYLFDKHGVHPNRDLKDGIYASSGSLGHGLGIAVGMALSDRSRNVYCLISDGECAEGSIWESLRIARDQKLTNLKVYLNANGFGAYDPVDQYELFLRIKAFFPTVDIYYTTNPYLYPGLEAHYKVMSEEDYKQLSSIYEA